MKQFILVILVIFIANLFTPGLPAYGQKVDLEKLRKEEEERQKKLKKSGHKGRVVSNKSLKEEGLRKETDEVDKKYKKSGDKDEKTDPTKTREYWQKLKEKIENNLKNQKALVEQVQLEVNRLMTEHLLMDLPLEKQKLKEELDKAKKNLELQKMRLANAQKEYDELPEKARKAGVPPGWIR